MPKEELTILTFVKSISLYFYSKKMSERYKISNPDELYFVTCTVVNWIDLFTRNEYKDEIVKSIKYCQEHKGLEVYGWVIMTNHLHMIAGSNKNLLSDILRDFKTYTSKRLHTIIEQNTYESRKEWLLWMMEQEGKYHHKSNNWKLWQDGNHPMECYNKEVFHQKLDYIHYNPVKAGFVDNPEDWKYSSAIGYSDNSGMIKLHYY
jgi:putative transposase